MLFLKISILEDYFIFFYNIVIVFFKSYQFYFNFYRKEENIDRNVLQFKIFYIMDVNEKEMSRVRLMISIGMLGKELWGGEQIERKSYRDGECDMLI